MPGRGCAFAVALDGKRTMSILLSSISLARAGENGRVGYLDGEDLLKDLRGETGEGLRSMALGYVMAVRDAMDESAGIRAVGNSRRTRPTLEQEAYRVQAWLEAHPGRRDGIAAALVQAALGSAPVARTPQHGFAPAIRARLSGFLGFVYGAPALGAAGIAAIVFALTAGAWWTGRSAEFALNPGVERAFEESVRASEVTNLLLEERRYEKDSFINIGDRVQVGLYARKWEVSRRALGEAIQHLDQLDLSEADRQTLHDVESDFHEYVDGYERVLAQIDSGRIRTTQDANLEIAKIKLLIHRMEFNAAAISTHANRRVGTIA